MPWPQTGATQYHAQFGLPDKGRAIKGLVVCYVGWLGPDLAQGPLIWFLVVVRMAIELKYRNTLKKHFNLYGVQYQLMISIRTI